MARLLVATFGLALLAQMALAQEAPSASPAPSVTTTRPSASWEFRLTPGADTPCLAVKVGPGTEATFKAVNFGVAGRSDLIRLTAAEGQVHVRGAGINAYADCVKRSGSGGVILTLEGNVRIQFDQVGRNTWGSASRVVMDLATGQVEIKPTPTTSARAARGPVNAAEAHEERHVEFSRGPGGPPYMIDPPDVLVIEVLHAVPRSSNRIEPLDKLLGHVSGEHVVPPGGHISLGAYGAVRVAGLTEAQAKHAIEDYLSKFLQNPEISVSVAAYNSKFCSVIVKDGPEKQVYRFQSTGNETVLDAFGFIRGIPPTTPKLRVWVARPKTNRKGHDVVLPVDYNAIVQDGDNATNYQLFPGDRVFISAGNVNPMRHPPTSGPMGATLLNRKAAAPAAPKAE